MDGVGHGVFWLMWWGMGRCCHASLHGQLVFAPGALLLINPLYSEPYKI